MSESLEITSKRLSAVKSKNTKPEIIVSKYLHSKGLRYRLHSSNLPGKPDLTFKKHRSVLFINGCYWHRHKGCIKTTIPKKNIAFWNEKFNRNIERDKQNKQKLESNGWRVFIIWECEINDGTLDDIIKDLRSDQIIK